MVDLDAALDRLGDDRELLESVVEMVLESCPSLIAKVRAAVLDRDAKSLEFAAHTLRGLIANFGAATTCELAFQLELMGKEGNLAESEAVTTALEVELKRVISKLTSLVGEYVEDNAVLVS